MTPNPFYRQRAPRDEPPLDCANPFALSARVGEWGANAREDVGKIEVLMKLAGVHDLAPTDGPTGFFGSRLRTVIQKYQKDRGLVVDGEVNPDGETLRTLAHDLQHMGRNGDTVLAHLTPEEATFLHTITDGGSINPQTGLLEFWSDNDSENAESFGSANAAEQANDQAAENDAQGAAFGGGGDGMASVRAVNRAREHARAAARAREAARQAQRAEQARQAREREQRARMRDLERREEQDRKEQERQARQRQQLQKQREERTGLLASKEQSPEDNDAQWGSGLWGANDDQATENAAQKDAKTSKNDPAGYGDTPSVDAVNKAFRERQQKGIKDQLEVMEQKKEDEAKRARDPFRDSHKPEPNPYQGDIEGMFNGMKERYEDTLETNTFMDNIQEIWDHIVNSDEFKTLDENMQDPNNAPMKTPPLEPPTSGPPPVSDPERKQKEQMVSLAIIASMLLSVLTRGRVNIPGK